MQIVSTRLTFALLALLLGMAVVAGCSNEDQERAGSAASQTRDTVNDAWAGMRTDGERLIDTLQTRNDPEVKQDLLDSCRSTLERMRRADSAAAERVDALCNKIRDTDARDSAAWSAIKDQWRQLNAQFERA